MNQIWETDKVWRINNSAKKERKYKKYEKEMKIDAKVIVTVKGNIKIISLDRKKNIIVNIRIQMK